MISFSLNDKVCFYLIAILPLCIIAQNDKGVKTIHVFVALCDNENQGIVPVNASLGNGQSPRTNLYWGALYGVKTHFKRSKDWRYVKTIITQDTNILERILFKHKTTNTYLLADAYDGRFIKETTIAFLKATGGDQVQRVKHDSKDLAFGGGSGLVAYIGHDGLMEFNLEETFSSCEKEKDAIVLACVSKGFFAPYLLETGANPLVWSTGLMSPEAYTLKAAIDGWINNETDDQIRERAVQAYNQYQKCGIRGARNLLVNGF